MSNKLSLLFYIASFAGSAYFFNLGKKYRVKIATLVALLIPILISGLRYGVGSDYFAYIAQYNILKAIPVTEYLKSYAFGDEITFYFLTKISQFLSGGEDLLFWTAGVLTIVFLYLGIKKYKPPHETLVFFLMLLTIFPSTLNNIRQGITISIFFFASSYIIERKAIQYFILILFASTIHTSAIVLIPLYFLNRIIKPSNGKMVNIIKLGATALGTSLILPRLLEGVRNISTFSKYELYQSYVVVGKNYTFGLKLAIVALCIIVFIHLRPRIQNYYFLLFSLLEVMLLTLGFTSAFTKRIALYFSPFFILLIACVPEVFANKRLRYLAQLGLILYGVMFFTVSYYILGQANIIPYRIG